MKLRLVIVIALIVLATHSSSYGQVPKVRFYPQNDITFCKGCFGHFGVDGWRVKLILENLSGNDLIVYGNKLDGKFDFSHDFQYRNPDVCEWQYGYGSSEKRCDWKCKSTIFKEKLILKSGESIEKEGGVLDTMSAPERLTAYVATDSASEPYEIFSEPYLLLKSSSRGILPQVAGATLEIVENECIPNCKILTEASPMIRGVRLGMRLTDFVSKFPQAKISKLNRANYNYKYSFLREWSVDPYYLNVTFLDDKVAHLEVQFKSLMNTRWRTDFYKLISQTVGMPSYWPPFQHRWECQDFLVEVTPNQNPTITISTKNYLKVRDIINDESLNLKRTKNAGIL